MQATIPKRFYTIDFLRGIAALSVVCNHWVMFYYNGLEKLSYQVSQQPFYSLLSLFYKHGAQAVDLFFCISGFIFFWLYSTPIHQRQISGRTFAWLRLTRLFPLHFASLLLVLLLQVWLRSLTGSDWIYSQNNWQHFLLNLGFFQSWGLENGLSFNGPAWSVSVEMFLYLIFFWYVKLSGGRQLWLTGVLAIASFVIFNGHLLPSDLDRGLMSFFIGGTVYLFYKTLLTYSSIAPFGKVFGLLTVAVWLVVFIPSSRSVVLAVPQSLGIPDNDLNIVERLVNLYSIIVLFPVTILALALIETSRGYVGRQFKTIGDISYSVYLLHFPLMLVFIVISQLFGTHPQYFQTHDSFILYFVVLVSSAYCSYRFFEKPCLEYLRTRKFFLLNQK